jgi:hypothetical protein
MANGTTGTAEKDAKFLELLSQGATVGAAARGAGYARRSLYRWRKARADFAAAWDDAVEAGTDILEDEALRRARDGVDEPRFYEGEVCGHVRRYSERRAGALKMRRHANQVNANPRWAGPDMGMSDAVAQIPNW